MNVELPHLRSWMRYHTRSKLSETNHAQSMTYTKWTNSIASRISLAGITAVLLLGCSDSSGPEKVAVSGAVSIDGTPIEQGSISFVSLKGGRTSATKITDGEYHLARGDGPYPGPQKVVIQAFEKTGKVLTVNKSLPTPPGEGPAIPSGGLKFEETRQILPAKYNTDSQLTATLESGNNRNVNFDLTLTK